MISQGTISAKNVPKQIAMFVLSYNSFNYVETNIDMWDRKTFAEIVKYN
jgi:hypothetical protein